MSTAHRVRRSVQDSLVQMTEIVMPEDTNPRGTVFGGRVLALIDKCAAVVAMRHSHFEVVTVNVDSVTFHNKVRVGDILLLGGRLNAVFDSSMEIEVDVCSEDPRSGDRRLTTTAYVTMVAVGDGGRPTAAPPLEATTAEDRERVERASERRRSRLTQRLKT